MTEQSQMSGGSRFGGILRRLTARLSRTSRWALAFYAVATISASVWTSWTMSAAYAHGHPGNMNDFTWAILNAGGQSRFGGLEHLYSGGGSILVALPGFQLFLVFLVRIVGLFGGSPPADNLVIFHGHGGYAAIGVVWPVMAASAYCLAFAALFPLLSFARRCGLAGARLVVYLAAATAGLWWMSVTWGHPDDAVAVGLLVAATNLMLLRRDRGAAWLLGVGFAVQPLVLLAAPLLLALRPVRVWPRLLLRVAAPGLLAIAIPLLGDPRDTWRQVVEQPTYPGVGHPTPWVALVPHPFAGVVYAGWPRAVGVVVALIAASLLARRIRARGGADPIELLWVMGGCLALRCVFESVIFPYYVVPPLLLALAVSALRSPASLVVCLLASATAGYTSTLHTANHLLYWSVVVGCLGVAVLASRPPAAARHPAFGVASADRPVRPSGKVAVPA